MGGSGCHRSLLPVAGHLRSARPHPPGVPGPARRCPSALAPASAGLQGSSGHEDLRLTEHVQGCPLPLNP